MREETSVFCATIAVGKETSRVTQRPHRQRTNNETDKRTRRALRFWVMWDIRLMGSGTTTLGNFADESGSDPRPANPKIMVC